MSSAAKQNVMDMRKRTIGPVALAVTVVATGAVVLMIEIVGARMVSPYFGVSLYVWSSLITVTLLSLAGGYWAGGKAAEAWPDPAHLFDLALGAAAVNALVPLVSSPVLGACGALGLRAGSFAATVILFAAPLFLLGMVTPYAVKMAAKPGSPVAALTGRLYALSTLGSVAGALGAGFFLVPLLPVDSALFLLSAALAAVAAVPFALWKRPLRLAASLLVVALCGFFALRPAALPSTDRMRVVARTESFYGDVRVVDSAAKRSLLLNGIVQGNVGRDGMPVDRYFYFVDRLFGSCRPAARDFLVIGLGAGSFPRLHRGRATRVDAVEIDPAVADLARAYFGYREDKGMLFLEDGRYYIRRTGKTYDAIFIDVYAAESLPTHLFTVESFLAMARILNREGVVAINFHDFRDAPRDIATRSLVRTLRTAFRHVLAFEVQPWHHPAVRNIAFLASDMTLEPVAVPGGDLPASVGPLPDAVPLAVAESGIVLTDRFNPLDRLYNPVSEIMRTSTLAAFPRKLLMN